MSHFTVMVVGENPEEQLAPFEESPENDDYLEFCDCTEEVEEDWKNKTETRVVMPDGSLKSPYDNVFRVPNPDGFGSSIQVPEDLKKIEIPVKELYKSITEFAREYHGYRKIDGRYGYFHNPSAKWDWYQLGGRWRGFFKAKDVEAGTLGAPGVFGNSARPDYVDQIRKGDIDFKGMDQDEAIEAGSQWDKFHEILAGREFPDWEKIREQHGSEHIDDARKEWHNHPVIVDFGKADWFFWGDEFKPFLKSREDFVNYRVERSVATFAVLMNGTWYERGEMGWWGFVHDEKDDDVWMTEFKKLFDTLSDDTLISIFDCHI